MPDVVIHEVGPRDGLQMEKSVVPLDVKESWIRRTIAAGVDIVQVGSFVHPDKVPQMADTDELFRRLVARKDDGAILSGLVLNEKGLERGLACGVEMFCMGASASETHSRKNTGMDTGEAIQRILAAAMRARETGARVQLSVQSAFGCGFEGPIPENASSSWWARTSVRGSRRSVSPTPPATLIPIRWSACSRPCGRSTTASI
jgi:hydroxymethylglutaryl-CoA lyase